VKRRSPVREGRTGPPAGSAARRDAPLGRVRGPVPGTPAGARSLSSLDGAICSSGTTSPVSGRVWVTSARWVSSSSSSCRMPVWRRVSTIAQLQNASSSAFATSMCSSAASRRTRTRPAPRCPPLRRSDLATTRWNCSPSTSKVSPTTVGALVAASKRSVWSRCSSTLLSSVGSKGASSRVRWCMRARRWRCCFMLPRTSESRTGQRTAHGAQDGSSSARWAISR
jgi:hypothetical protein